MPRVTQTYWLQFWFPESREIQSLDSSLCSVPDDAIHQVLVTFPEAPWLFHYMVEHSLDVTPCTVHSCNYALYSGFSFGSNLFNIKGIFTSYLILTSSLQDGNHYFCFIDKKAKCQQI